MPSAEATSLMRRVAGTLGFGLFVGPGPVVGLVPWLITRWRIREPFLGWGGMRWVGAVLLAAGCVLLLDAFVRFVRRGRGTPAPVAPPQHVVVSGPYRYVRNPMYVAVVGMTIGQALVLGSVWLILYSVGVWFLLHLFVVLYEEPDLSRRFGPAYDEYRQASGRWLPRLRTEGPTRSARRGVSGRTRRT